MILCVQYFIVWYIVSNILLYDRVYAIFYCMIQCVQYFIVWYIVSNILLYDRVSAIFYCMIQCLQYFIVWYSVCNILCDSDMTVSEGVGIGFNVIRHNQEVWWGRLSNAHSWNTPNYFVTNQLRAAVSARGTAKHPSSDFSFITNCLDSSNNDLRSSCIDFFPRCSNGGT
jgi:hypothetical protein